VDRFLKSFRRRRSARGTPLHVATPKGKSVEFSQGTAKKSGLHVLIVDDELLIRWSLAETLTAAGHTVTEAADPKAVAEAIQAEIAQALG